MWDLKRAEGSRKSEDDKASVDRRDSSGKKVTSKKTQ